MLFVLALFLVSVGGATAAGNCEACACTIASAPPLPANPQNPGCLVINGELKCGPCMISLQYYMDCGVPTALPTETLTAAWTRCSFDFECSKVCVHRYWLRFQHNCTPFVANGCEIMIRNHFGGPTGCTNPATLPFYQEARALGCA